MTRLILITMLMITAAGAMAANVYLPPIRERFTDTTILPVYYNTSGARGLTGLRLKQEISAFAHLSTSRRIADATQIFNLMTSASPQKLVKRAASYAGTYDRVMEIKDKTGKIVYYVQQNGNVTVGTPVPLWISSVSPANGATNVSNGTWFNYSSSGGGWARINTTTPTITFNKSRVSVSISNTMIVGSALTPYTDGSNVYQFRNFSGAAGATYTLRVTRGTITQTDGETSSSCGSAMTDVAGICQSTFTMK